jgi:hypothetical protein
MRPRGRARRLAPMTAPRTLLLSTALATAAATAALPAAAGARSPLSTERLLVTIEGQQVVEWQYRTDGWPDPTRTWTKGEGAQEQHFSNEDKPLAMKLLIVRVPGHRSVSLLPVKPGQTELPGRIARAQIWDPHTTPNCGGELGDCSKLQAPPAPAPFDCSERPLPMIVRDLKAPGPHGADDVYLDISTEPVRPFDNCPPDQPAGAIPGGFTTVRDQAPLELSGAVRKLVKLRRGASVDLKVKLQTGLNRFFRFSTSCPKLSGLGFQECTTTEVTLHVKRVR